MIYYVCMYILKTAKLGAGKVILWAILINQYSQIVFMSSILFTFRLGKLRQNKQRICFIWGFPKCINLIENTMINSLFRALYFFSRFRIVTVKSVHMPGEYTYLIIAHYNPSVRIIGLVSHTTYAVCVNFIHKWRDLQFQSRRRTTDFLRNSSWQFY